MQQKRKILVLSTRLKKLIIYKANYCISTSSKFVLKVSLFMQVVHQQCEMVGGRAQHLG